MPTLDFLDLHLLLDLAADAAPLLILLTLKATVLLALGWGLARLVRGASAAWRHAIWAGTLGAVLVVSVSPLALPTWELAVPLWTADGASVAASELATGVADTDATALRATEQAAAERAALLTPFGAEAAEAVALDTVRDTARATSLWDLVRTYPLATLVLVWALGVLAVGGWWLIGACAAWRLAARAMPVKDGAWLSLLADVAEGLDLRRPVRLLQSDRLTVPVTWGAVGPVLILPAEADDWNADRRRAVLAHELAHVRRRDVLWQWVAQLACALHWYQPIAWVAYRRLLAEREHACDDAVLRAGTRPSAYADVLLDVARSVRRREPLATLAMAPMARRSQLEGRLLSILDPSLDRRALSRVLLTVLGATTLLVAASLAGVQPVPAQAAVGDEAPFDLAGLAAPATPSPSATPAPPATPSPRALPTGLRQTLDEDFQWDGTLTPGKRLIVKNTNGEVKARGVNSDRAVVEAEKEEGWRGRGNPDDVEVEVVEFRDGIVVCVRYEGQRGECGPDSTPQGDMDSDVSVTFSVEVPRGVHFEGASVNGAVEALGLSGDVTVTSVNGAVKASTSGGDVEATTVNGAVEATASGSVQARTVNGAIRADMGRADWSGTAEYSTVNGAIDLTLPADFSAEVRAETGSGGIRSDFPLDIEEGRYVGASASGTIGSGGRRMKLTTQNGSISLRRSRATLHRGDADRRRAASETGVRERAVAERRASAPVARPATHDARRVAELRAAVVDTLRAARHLAMASASDVDVRTGDFNMQVGEQGLQIVVDGHVEVDLDWHELTDEALRAVQGVFDEADWGEIGDEMEAAFEEARQEVRESVGHIHGVDAAHGDGDAAHEAHSNTCPPSVSSPSPKA